MSTVSSNIIVTSVTAVVQQCVSLYRHNDCTTIVECMFTLPLSTFVTVEVVKDIYIYLCSDDVGSRVTRLSLTNSCEKTLN